MDIVWKKISAVFSSLVRKCEIDEGDVGREFEDEGGVEVQWGSLPTDLLTQIVDLGSTPPSSPFLTDEDEKEVITHYRNYWGKLRLVNKHWCSTVDCTINVLRPDCTRLNKGTLGYALANKFKSVDKLAFHNFGGGHGIPVSYKPLSSLYGGWPIKDVDSLHLGVATALRVDEGLTTVSSLAQLSLVQTGQIADPALHRQLGMYSFSDVTLSNLVCISQFANLTHLFMGDIIILDDMAVFSHLTALCHLDMRWAKGPIGGLETLLALTRLTHLHLGGDLGYDPMHCPIVANLSNLKALGCSLFPRGAARYNTQYLTDLDLTSLDVWWMSSEHEAQWGMEEGVSDLSKLTSLEVVRVHADEVPRPFWLGLLDVPTITSLEFDDVNGGCVQDNMDLLTCMPNLKSLAIHADGEEYVPLDSLTQLVNLTALSVHFPVELPYTITRLKCLEHLDVRTDESSVIRDCLRQIGKMTQLRSLKLGCLRPLASETREHCIDTTLRGLLGLFDARLSYCKLTMPAPFRASWGYSDFARWVQKKYPTLFLVL